MAENLNPTLNGIPQGLYYYFLEKEDNVTILGNCPAIQNVVWSPFIEKDDLVVDEVEYDYSRFSDKYVLAHLKRIRNLDNNTKTLATVNKYDVTTKPVTDGSVSWKNEGRLFQHPYNYAILTNYIDTPFQVRYDMVPGDNITVKCKTSISDTSKYYLYVDRYKNDIDGKMEGIPCNGNMDIPLSSDAYVNYMAYNKNAFNNNIKATELKNTLNKQIINEQYANNTLNAMYGNNANSISQANTSVSGLLGLIGGDIGGGIGAVQSNYFSGKNASNSYDQAISNADSQKTISTITSRYDYKTSMDSILAKKQDLQDAPSSVSGFGSNVAFSQTLGEKKLDLVRYRIKNEYRERLGDYFIRFGYKYNKSIKLDTAMNTRKYFNYVKCSNVNIFAPGIPIDALEVIKNIFLKGTTVWHKDMTNLEDNVEVGAYHWKDNKETYNY